LIDFTALQPNSSEFKSEWINHQTELVEILSQNVKNSTMVKKLKNLKTLTGNQTVATILLGLHHALFSSGVHLQGKNSYKATIAETFKFFLFLTRDESTKETDLIIWRQDIATRKLKQQAIIVGFGSGTDDVNDKFCVIFEDLQYTFDSADSLIMAMALVLKIYSVFNVSYPVLNHPVFSFLAQKYLDVNEPANKKGSGKLSQIMNSFK
jgi:hypothetical protein